MANDYKLEKMRGISEKGIYNKKNWISEADNHFFSSTALRKLFSTTKQEINPQLKTFFRTTNSESDGVKVNSMIKESEAAAKSSILLIGYAIELYLKAGLVRIYQNMPRADFDKTIKNHGHNLVDISSLLGIRLSKNENKALERIKKLILDEARYPLTPSGPDSFHEKSNRISSEVWGENSYNTWKSLAQKIKEYVSQIDCSKADPVHTCALNIDSDGYCLFHIGGTLQPYVTVKYSSNQVKDKKDNIKHLLELVISTLPDSINKRLIELNKNKFKEVRVKRA